MEGEVIDPHGISRRDRSMRTLFQFFIFLFFSLSAVSAVSVKELEKRLHEIDEALQNQSTLSLQTGVGAIGERSAVYKKAAVREWFQVTFSEVSDIDQIVLVPALWRDETSLFLSDGFPVEFHIEVGYEGRESEVVASFKEEDQVLPRTAPVVVDVSVQGAKWVKVVATKLSPRLWDGAFLFQLSEILVFKGKENIALHQKVTGASEEGEEDHGARRRAFLVDGNLPYLMNTSEEEKSNAYRFRVYDQRKVNLTVDLGKECPVSTFLYHTLEVSDSIPQSNRSDFGLPRHFQVYGASESDFSDAELLTEYRFQSAYDFSPIIHLSFPDVSCRYLKVTLNELDFASAFEVTDPFYFFSCAEMELLSQGENVLRGKVFSSDYFPDGQLFEYEAFEKAHLTDGRNMFGSVLPVREWLGQLAERHRLKVERPLVLAEISARYAQQEVNFRRLQWLLFTLLVLGAIGYLLSRLMQMKRISQIRQRFAADLHDELGANLHAIGILSDVAEDCVEGKDEEHLRKTIKEIRATTERTADSARNSIYTDEGRPYQLSFKADMERVAERMFTGMNYEVSVEGEDVIKELPVRIRHDLFLFYKECLANISRHSGATQFKAMVSADRQEIRLDVSDNGAGDPSTVSPPSLVRRAKFLKAKLRYDSSTHEPRGVNITLTLKPPKKLFSTP